MFQVENLHLYLERSLQTLFSELVCDETLQNNSQCLHNSFAADDYVAHKTNVRQADARGTNKLPDNSNLIIINS